MSFCAELGWPFVLPCSCLADVTPRRQLFTKTGNPSEVQTSKSGELPIAAGQLFSSTVQVVLGVYGVEFTQKRKKKKESSLEALYQSMQ